MFYRTSFWMLVACGILLSAAASHAAEPPKVKVLVVSNSGHHDFKAFGQFVADLLGKTGHFEVTPPEKANGRDLFKPDVLKGYQVVLIFGSGDNFRDAAQEKALAEFVRGGGGLLGVHATDANKSTDLYWEIMGGRQTAHTGGTLIRVTEEKHFITEGLKDFQLQDETYNNKAYPGAKLAVLATGDRGKEAKQDMVWVQQVEKGRVCNITFGHGKGAWQNPSFQQLLVRGMYWTAGIPQRMAVEKP